MSDNIRVLLVDDQEIVRSALSAFLWAYNLEPVGEASNGEEAVQLCDQYRPDVVLMDLVMPQMDGATATRIIRQRWPQTQVIAITSFEQDRLLQGAINAGAAAAVLKNISAQDLACTIEAVHAGQTVPLPPLADSRPLGMSGSGA